jgi:hypothetical protein
MTRKNILGEATCDHCQKNITTTGETVYGVHTFINVLKIGEDPDERYQTKKEKADQEIHSDLCFECYRDLEQVLQNAKKEEEEGGGKEDADEGEEKCE